MTQKERDRLVALKKASKGLIAQMQAAAEMGVTVRQIRPMPASLKARRQGGSACRARTALEPAHRQR